MGGGDRDEDARGRREHGFRLGEFTVRPDLARIVGPEGPRRVEHKAMRVLVALAARPGEVVSREELNEEVWEGRVVGDEALTHAIWVLRSALDDDAREPRFIETVPRRGYRLVAPVAAWPAHDAAAGDGLGPSPALAVLPFVDLSPSGDYRWLGDGVAEELTHALTRVAGLRVVSRTSAFQFGAPGHDVLEVGERLGAQLLLEGSVRATDDRLRVLARLVDAGDGVDLWGETFDRPAADLLAVEAEIVEAIAARLARHIAGSAPPPPTEIDLESHHLYLKGRFFCGRRTLAGLQAAVRLLTAATRRQPRFARAQAGLADAHLLLSLYGGQAPAEALPPARAAVQAALEQDPRLAEAHTSRGLIHSLFDYRFGAAESAFREAIAIDPQHAEAHLWLGVDCLLPAGRMEEAGRLLARARDLDPLAPAVGASRGLWLRCAGRPEEAVRELESVLELAPDLPAAHQFLGLAELDAGRIEEGLAALRRAVEIHGAGAEARAALAYGLGRAGQEGEGRRLLGELEAERRERWVSPALLAQVHCGLGEAGAALDRLEEALEERSPEVAWLAVKPEFAVLAGAPRFAALLDRLGLPARADGDGARRGR